MTNEVSNERRRLTDSPEDSQFDGPAKLSTQTIESLFARFAAIYGVKFADQWAGIDQAAVKATWASGLSELRREEIVSGLQSLVRSGRPFPPTLPEFYALCRPKIEIPPANDHAGLDALARKHGVSTAGCDSYFALRQRLIERVNGNRGASALLEDRG